MAKQIKMSGMIVGAAKLATVLAAGLALTACPKDSDLDCLLDDTASVSFVNTPGGATNVYVEWDGVLLVSNIADGAASAVITVPAGPHTATFRNTSGNGILCTQAVTPLACTATVYSCGG